MDFIERWIEIIREHTDIPKKFCTATGYSLIAQTLGRFYELGEVIGYRPNLYILLSSPPRFTRRGALFGHFRYTIDTCFHTYHQKLGDKKYLDEIKSHQLDGGSPQGLCDDIKRFRENKITSQAVRSPEFGRKLVDIFTNKGYMKGMDGIYLQLYSGESIYESFSRKQGGQPRYVPYGTYFNILGSLQGIEDYLKRKEIASMGFARRLSIWRVEGDEVVDDFKGMFNRDTRNMQKKLKELGIQLGNVMYKTNKIGKLIPLPCTKDVKEEHTKIDKKLTTRAKIRDNDAYSLFLQGQIDMILKFSMNRAISKEKPVIDIETFTEAKDDVKESTRDLKDVFELMNVPEEERMHERNVNAVLRCIKRRKSRKYISQYMQGYGVKSKGLEKIYKELLKDSKIVLNKNGDYDVK